MPRRSLTAEGKAHSSRYSPRHSSRAKTLVLGDGEEATALAALRGALAARHLPRDAAEAHWAEELAFAAWRQRRLRALEAEALARAGAAGEESEAAPALPSLSTLNRYRARLDRDWRRASEELELLRLDRAVPPSPAQLRLAPDLIEQGQPVAERSPEKCTNENLAPGMNEPDAPARGDEPARDVGTNEPNPAANRTNGTARGMDEPRYPVPPLPGTRTDEPDAPPTRPLNRHQRRRHAALARRGLRPAA